MKKGLVITGIALIIFSTISIVNVTEGQSGAGLYGMLTFYIIMLIVSSILIYLGARDTKEKGKYFKNKKDINQSSNYDNNYQSLKDLHNQGILTDDEYYEKTAKIKSERLQSEIKQTTEYQKLKSLFNEGILTKDEFDKKVDEINKRGNFDETDYFKEVCRIKAKARKILKNKDYQIIQTQYKINKEDVDFLLRVKLEEILHISSELEDREFIEIILRTNK